MLRGTISQGDTAGVLLQEWLPAEEVHSLVNACKNVYSLARLRAGQAYVIYREGDQFSRFEYEIDDNRRLVVCREDARWVATVEDIQYDILLEKVEGSIESSMFESMSDIGESPVLAVRLADIFAWEINFIRDIQPGDGFRVLLEKRYRDGEFKGYGKMLAAEFVNKGSKYEAFLYKDSFGNTAYFNAAGDSLKRAFLKAPLSFTRVSSRFNLRRVHPIFNSIRAHPAVDYAAPSGTPVKAIGSGTVTFRGWGKGAGNYISLKHANGYESMYLHLSGFAKNLQKGGRVRQGDVIGYVGSAVMLNARLAEGVNLMHVVAMTQALGELLSPEGADPEVYRWTDGTQSHVTCEFRHGKLVKWTLVRPEGEAAATPPQG